MSQNTFAGSKEEVFMIIPIFRENQSHAFGVWLGNLRTTFGRLPDAIFETYEEAYRFALTKEEARQ